MILFLNIYMTYLIFSKFFKYTFVILIGYFFYIGDILLNIFLEIFIICQYFFKLLLIIIFMKFPFVNIFYLNNVSFGVGNVKTINGTYSLTIIAKDFSNYRGIYKKYLYLCLSHLKILSHCIIFFGTILF